MVVWFSLIIGWISINIALDFILYIGEVNIISKLFISFNKIYIALIVIYILE